MTIDFRNVNTLWASVFVETLHCLGLTTAIICPGSRSSPLAITFAQHPHIDAIPILDERSAAFFALGMGKRLGKPVALVCTSGTAGANFYPAIIEAKESRVPILVITADRPPELRHCHAGQTIDQVKLYGHYPNWQAELAVPSVDMGKLRYLRQIVAQAWERSLYPTPGVVHLNIPFAEPLAPIDQLETVNIATEFDSKEFFEHLSPIYPSLPTVTFNLEQWRHQRGIIIAGVASSHSPKDYCHAIAQLSQYLQYPVLAEALSPLRNYAYLNPFLVCTYDLLLRHPQLTQELAPEIVIQLGELPTSKELRTWLDTLQPLRWIIDPSPENLDALHGRTIHLRTTIEQLIQTIPIYSYQTSPYCQKWCELDRKVRENIGQTLQSIDYFLEGKIAWLLSQHLPNDTPIFIANSMPIRDAEFFWMPNQKRITPYFNRGANGIDGILSTALGIAYQHNSSILLTGDLAFLHDTNGLLISQKFIGSLTIVLINNNGGGIFEMLPIAKFYPTVEEFFATPQNVNFALLCQSYGVERQLVTDWEHFIRLIKTLPEQGIRVLEVRTDRKADAIWLREHLNQFAAELFK